MTYQFTGIDIFKGAWEGDPTPRWFLVGQINDGSEIVMDMKLSEDEALTEALTYDVPIRQHVA